MGHRSPEIGQKNWILFQHFTEKAFRVYQSDKTLKKSIEVLQTLLREGLLYSFRQQPQ